MRVRAAGALRAGDHRSQRGGEPDRPASRQDGVSGGELRAGGAAADRRLCGVRAAAADTGLQSIWRSRRTTAARARDCAARARSPARPDPAAQCAARDPGRARASMDVRGVRGSAAARCRWRSVGRPGANVRAVGSADRPGMVGRTSSADGGTARRAGGPCGCIQRDCRTGGARRDRRAPGASRRPCLRAQTESIAGAVEASVETAPIAPEADGPEFLDGVDAAGAERPRRFIEWVRQGIADGTLPVNVRGALVHGVEDGLLLASPGIFRAFIRRDGAGQG